MEVNNGSHGSVENGILLNFIMLVRSRIGCLDILKPTNTEAPPGRVSALQLPTVIGEADQLLVAYKCHLLVDIVLFVSKRIRWSS